MNAVADPDRPCPHPDFSAWVEVARITKGVTEAEIAAAEGGPVNGFMAEMHLRCAACDEQFRWIGQFPVGSLPDGPAVSPDGYELRVPVAPGSSDEDFGMGLGGFIVRTHSDASPDDPDGRPIGSSGVQS
jgi:hypothetical protein